MVRAREYGIDARVKVLLYAKSIFFFPLVSISIYRANIFTCFACNASIRYTEFGITDIMRGMAGSYLYEKNQI